MKLCDTESFSYTYNNFYLNQLIIYLCIYLFTYFGLFTWSVGRISPNLLLQDYLYYHLKQFLLNKKINFSYTVKTYIPVPTFIFFRFVLSGWSSSGGLEEDGARRGESHHPGQPWAKGRQPRPQQPPTTRQEGPVRTQWESDRATYTPQRSPTKTSRR